MEAFQELSWLWSTDEYISLPLLLVLECLFPKDSCNIHRDTHMHINKILNSYLKKCSKPQKAQKNSNKKEEMSWLYNIFLGYKGSWFSSQDNKGKKNEKTGMVPQQPWGGCASGSLATLGRMCQWLQSKGLRTHKKCCFCASPDGGKKKLSGLAAAQGSKRTPLKHVSLTALWEGLPFCHQYGDTLLSCCSIVGVALTSGLAPNFNSGVVEKRPIQKSYGTIYIQQSKPEGKQAEELVRSRKENFLPVRRGCRVIFVLQLNKGGRRTDQNRTEQVCMPRTCSECHGRCLCKGGLLGWGVSIWCQGSPLGDWELRGLLLLRLRLHVLGKVLSNQA